MKNDQNIRIEELLLIKLCRLEFADQLKSDIESICRREIDWEVFSATANNHGVSALVYSNLKRFDLIKFLPSAWAEFLRNALFMSMTGNTGKMRMMEDVLKILNQENIRTVLLKGMALELMIYGNEGLRQMSDADVLISKDKSMRAFGLLRKKGFRPLPVKSFFHRPIIKYIGKHLPSLIKNGFTLEIHHTLFAQGNAELTARFLETAAEAELNGQRVWLPNPKMLFLYLFYHLYRHESENISHLRLYSDLAVMIEHYGSEIINTDLLKLSGEAALNHELAGKMLILRDYWNISFPSWMNDFIGANAEEDADSRFIFFLRSPKNNPPADRSRSYRYMLKQIPGIHRKVIYVVGDLFPTIGFMKSRYHCHSAWQAALFYPHRLGKLMWLFRK